MRWVGHVALMGVRRGASRVSVGISGGNRPFERRRFRWDDNIKMGLQEVGWASMDWVYLAGDRDRWRAVMNAVMNLQVP